MECWGAQGGSQCPNATTETAGLGAYTLGKLNISSGNNLYVYVGGAGETPNRYSHDLSLFAYNGGGKGQRGTFDTNYYGSGGGATDIRTVNGNWDSFNSLKSRIMVAAGGGAISFGGSGGSGGTLKGEDGIPNDSVPTTADRGVDRHGYGGTQISGGKAGSFKWSHEPPTDGTFGQGGDGNSDYGGGGGGGYYGGGGSGVSLGARGGAGGGSSFISGHTGCNAISSSSTSTNIVHTGQPNHYSGKVFTNTVMKAGNEVMPSPTGGTETGHSGNGYCRIRWHPTI